MSFVLRRFCKIHRYKQGEDHRLYKSNKHFKKVEWYNSKLTNREKPYFDKTWEPDHNTDEDNSSKYISEETEREGEHTDKLSDTMEPSDNNIDTFFDKISTMKMKDKVSNISKETPKANHDHVWEKYHNQSHTKSSIYISIDGAKVVVEAWEEC